MSQPRLLGWDGRRNPALEGTGRRRVCANVCWEEADLSRLRPVEPLPVPQHPKPWLG